jgi:hypothetical protein
MNTDEHNADAEDWRARAQAAERDLAETVRAAEQRLIRAELKAEALRAGMVDLDGIKLAEIDTLSIDDKGEVPGAAALMQQLKRAKPWLFGGVSTSSGARAPAAQPPQQKLATEMNHDEWRSARAELLKRR